MVKAANDNLWRNRDTNWWHEIVMGAVLTSLIAVVIDHFV